MDVWQGYHFFQRKRSQLHLLPSTDGGGYFTAVLAIHHSFMLEEKIRINV